MNDLSFDEMSIVERLSSLPRLAWLLFALACAERLIPNYRAFQQRTRWGSVQALEDGVRLAWTRVRGAQITPRDVAQAQARVVAAEPETEDFEGPDVSPALDAAAAVGLVLEILEGASVETAGQAASLAVDTVDMYVDGSLGLEPSDPLREKKIRQHPLMQQELQRQAGDLELIERWSRGDLDLEELEQRLATGAGSLELVS